MKKLLTLIFIVVLFSCEKEPECMTCKTFISSDCLHDEGAYEEWIACGEELKEANGRVMNKTTGNCKVTLTTICKSKW